LKRVIGIGGDRVHIDGDVVRVNGVAVETAPGQESLGDHHYRVAHEPGLGPREAVDATVPAASLFLFGDNRANSFDSRQFGAVPLESVKGRVVLIWASFGEETVRWERFGIVPD
jgi:signal peptidase I